MLLYILNGDMSRVRINTLKYFQRLFGRAKVRPKQPPNDTNNPQKSMKPRF